MDDYVTQISSLNNTRIKAVVRLNNRRQRDKQRVSLVEGQREVERALQVGIVPVEAYICRDLLARDDQSIHTLRQLAEAGATQLFEVTPELFEKIAYRGNSGGLLLVIPYFNYSLTDLDRLQTPFLVVIDGAEKPGNLGAILRTADAAGVDGIILTNEEKSGTDIHNPNAIRASLGAIFSVPVVTAAVEDALSWLQDQQIMIVATSPDAEELYTAVSMSGPIAVVLGSEAEGLGKKWMDSADIKVQIPMFGIVDSLNLSVSTALLLYEVVRQRALRTASS